MQTAFINMVFQVEAKVYDDGDLMQTFFQIRSRYVIQEDFNDFICDITKHALSVCRDRGIFFVGIKIMED